MKKIIYLAIALVAISCSTDYPYYKTSQSYTSAAGPDGTMIYSLTTHVNRFTDKSGSSNDEATLVYGSTIQNIPSSKIDSVTLHEKSIANMRVSEFNHLDDITKPDEN